ncbi:MAG: isoaspartyl peptidase/L-asparaginase [Myxococcales bacterium]|nr:isoaspartyl peptidase/L-asparaginase [Myxococcales bacterium]
MPRPSAINRVPVLVGVLAGAFVGVGCDRGAPLPEVPAPTAHAVEDPMASRLDPDARGEGPLILAHGGQGSPAARSDGPADAVERGFALLTDAQSDATAAAIAVIEVLEDDPRFNAGTGANLRLDGRTIQADAALMDDRGHFGAVAGIDGIRHPILLAQAIAGSPHLLLAGDGALQYGLGLGLEPRALATDVACRKLERGYEALFAEDPRARAWADFDWRARWNFAGAAPEDLAAAQALIAAAEQEALARQGEGQEPIEPDRSQDTVGVVVRSGDGRYAAALSTGGTTLALRGRIGDVPVLGAGLYAGPDGAVAATGKGEAIMRERVAAEVYRQLAAGRRPGDAIELAMRSITPEEGVGVIAVSDLGWAARATSQMAWAARDQSALYRADTWVQHDGR